MTREEVKNIVEGITDDQLKALLDLHSVGIGKVIKENESLKTENETLKNEKETLENKVQELAENASDAENVKQELATLKEEIRKADEESAAREKENVIANRFSTALGEKEFSHDAIKADYLKKFSDALDNKEFEGKSDEEIFHELTKDDATAFKGVSALKLEGGKPAAGGSEKFEIPKIF